MSLRCRAPASVTDPPRLGRRVARSYQLLYGRQGRGPPLESLPHPPIDPIAQLSAQIRPDYFIDSSDLARFEENTGAAELISLGRHFKGPHGRRDQHLLWLAFEQRSRGVRQRFQRAVELGILDGPDPRSNDGEN